ncbi:Tad domain-containing protein [Parerythrobacter aestuarii]|uniref:Tad domain-containing protein n=1 Tax=Parerythrobacter aestuarii TaxID=3020909 RepID=UPI0024DE3ACA|nr:Tad domain-containing protein [Parerythrobacter aestuarii]
MKRLWNRLKSIGKDASGNVLIVVGIGTTSLVGAAGIGVDTVQWYLWNRQLQQAVDSGALAGALSLYAGSGYSQPARDEVQRNFPGTYTITDLRNPPTSGSYSGDNAAVEVIATTSQRLPFSSLFLSTPPTIRVRSVAATVADGEYCVISLASSGTGVEVQGSAQVDLGCGTSANSPDGIAVDLSGSSLLKSNPISAVGGIDYTSTNVDSGTTMLPYGLEVTDPMANRGLSVPSTPSTCTATNLNVTPNQTVTLNPGRYCGGMDLKGDVTLNPGVYIIDGGTLNINSQAEVYGDGVTFVLTGADPYSIATVSINGGADVEISAPDDIQDPTWAGVLFFQDPSGDATHTINGGADLEFDGIIYMPTGDISFSGGATQKADCLLLIAETVRFTGDTGLGNNCPTYVDSLDTGAKIVRVVE